MLDNFINTSLSCAKAHVLVTFFTVILLLTGCSPKPLTHYSTETSAMIMLPLSQTDSSDGRARFREIFCAITEKRGRSLPDYRDCHESLVRLSDEPVADERTVDLEKSRASLRVLIVPGIGWSCLENFLNLKYTVKQHLEQFDYEGQMLEVEALSSSARNAKLIRDAIMGMPDSIPSKPLLLLGYSKGTPDIMEAIVNYPELHSKITAVISVAGAVGGSYLANDVSQSTANLLAHFPGAECNTGDEGGLNSLKPEVRQHWLASHKLPHSIRYYSLVNYPEPDNISTALLSSYKKLSQIDARNDSQLIFYDQIIPGSTLLAYLNADHWATVVPISRSHAFIGSTFANKNAFPREILLEAILRYIEEDLTTANNTEIEQE